MEACIDPSRRRMILFRRFFGYGCVASLVEVAVGVEGLVDDRGLSIGVWKYSTSGNLGSTCIYQSEATEDVVVDRMISMMWKISAAIR
jgi:hypothetical protein